MTDGTRSSAVNGVTNGARKVGIMPAIITAPARTRVSSTGLKQSEVQEYIDLMVEILESDDKTQLVTVDDSERAGYEKAYARGERIRMAAIKYDLVPEGVKVQVIAFPVDEDATDRLNDTYVAGVRFKQA